MNKVSGWARQWVEPEDRPVLGAGDAWLRRQVQQYVEVCDSHIRRYRKRSYWCLLAAVSLFTLSAIPTPWWWVGFWSFWLSVVFLSSAILAWGSKRGWQIRKRIGGLCRGQELRGQNDDLPVGGDDDDLDAHQTVTIRRYGHGLNRRY